MPLRHTNGIVSMGHAAYNVKGEPWPPLRALCTPSSISESTGAKSAANRGLKSPLYGKRLAYLKLSLDISNEEHITSEHHRTRGTPTLSSNLKVELLSGSDPNRTGK